MARTQLNLNPQTERIIMTKTITFNSGNQFVAHVLPEPTDGPVAEHKKAIKRLRDQATKIKAERDQADATLKSATRQVAEMAAAGKSAKAISDVLAEAAHARFNIATIDEQLEIVSKARCIIGSYGATNDALKADPVWQQYLADCKRWRRLYDDGLHAIQKQHRDNAVNPVQVQGWEQQRLAKLEAERINTERWQEYSTDFADEMNFKFKRENQEPAEDGTTKRRLRA